MLVSAAATDDTKGTIRYTFVARRGLSSREVIGPQTESTAVFDLRPGECYTISVTAQDDSDCTLASVDATCAIESFCVPSGGSQTPADCNQDGTLDLSDGICLLGNLFLGNPSELPCGDSASEDPGNVKLLDSNGDGTVDLSDAAVVFGFLFLGAPGPVLGTECVPIVGCPASVGCDS